MLTVAGFECSWSPGPNTPDYMGTLAKSQFGESCHKWDSPPTLNVPGVKPECQVYFKIVPDDTNSHNFCRNARYHDNRFNCFPGGTLGKLVGPAWCLVGYKPGKLWYNHCKIPRCPGYPP
jgi:hypothetical protein